MVGETFGNYRIVRRLGSGAMGTVFFGEHERIARCAAIKVLAPEYAANAEILGRFFDEARATSLIHHPAIVEILDCGVPPDGRRPYIAMEYLAGETLASSLEREGSLPWQEACAIAAQIADGLSAAHRHHIVHRDVKPANVMRVRDPATPAGAAALGFVKVLDFGVAKLLQEAQSGARTHPGKLLGTPEYMAPEQCGAEGTVDARTDIYALGCVLFEMLVGKPPFPVTTLEELIVAHRWREPPTASSCADVPATLSALIARMLSKQQQDRPADMDSVASALRDLLARPASTPEQPPEGVGITCLGRAAPAIAHGPDQVSTQPALSPTLVLEVRLPARRRSLARAVAAVGLAIAAASAVIHLGRRGPKVDTPPVAWPNVTAARSSAPMQPPPSVTALTNATPETSMPAARRDVASVPPEPHAGVPATGRHARSAGRAHPNYRREVDADGIVDL
jgi:eukaryotic-like serine/threonine-protein kinase